MNDLDLNSTDTNTTHLLYDGKGGWIEAKRVYIAPHPDLGEDQCYGDGWQFKSGHDCVRWLQS